MLLLKSKLLTVLGVEEGAAQVEQSVQNFIDLNSSSYKALVLTYAERYFELSSMIFDLYPFIPFLSEITRREIADFLQAKLGTIADPVRNSRALITLYKVKKVFGLMKTEALGHARAMH